MNGEIVMAEKTRQELRKLAPRLRLIMSDDALTNALRADHAPDIAIQDPKLLSSIPQADALDARWGTAVSFSGEAEREELPGEPGPELVSVFIKLDADEHGIPKAVSDLATVTGRKQNWLTATVPKDRLIDLQGAKSVLAIEPGERIVFSPPLQVSVAKQPPDQGVRRIGGLDSPLGEAGVLIGIIDVGGFDFAHPDFLDANGGTRFVRIWDQGGDTRPPPKGFRYGAELTAEHLNAAIAAAPAFKIPAWRLEPQSQIVPSSHATHVASIAAGNRGVCPNALIAGVLVSFPVAGGDARQQFYDSTRLAHAVDYLCRLGQDLDLPVSINISLGTNGHAHDASNPISRWIDHALATQGRCVCAAAGNAGQQAPLEPDDMGFIMGRIHTGGCIPAAGLAENIEWLVGAPGITDVSDNELIIWYGSQDRFGVEIRPPGSDEWIGPVEPGEYLDDVTPAERTGVRIDNDLYVPANGHNCITLHLSPFRSRQGIVGIRPGTWLVRLRGRDVRDGSYHGWIERDDPRRMSEFGYGQDWSFPSFFSARSNVDESSVSSLACGQRVIAVANLDQKNERIHITSSQGPTRDGRQKPEIAAPGTNIVAANGFELDPDRRWVTMTGTSMASPYVAGVAGCMLAIGPQLTADQIAGIIRRTARPLPGTSYKWQNDMGFGQIDPAACVAEARRIR
jgi:subtilisin family serine protease